MIDGAELLAIGGIESVALLHLLPAHITFDGTSGATVAVEGDVKQEVRVERREVEGYIVVDLIDSQFGIQRFHLLAVDDDADIGNFFALLNGEQQITALSIDAQHGMPVGQDLWRLSTHGKPPYQACGHQ